MDSARDSHENERARVVSVFAVTFSNTLNTQTASKKKTKRILKPIMLVLRVEPAEE